jgi:hypothetical protein
MALCLIKHTNNFNIHFYFSVYYSDVISGISFVSVAVMFRKSYAFSSLLSPCLYSVHKMSTWWRLQLPSPCSLVHRCQGFGGASCLQLRDSHEDEDSMCHIPEVRNLGTRLPVCVLFPSYWQHRLINMNKWNKNRRFLYFATGERSIQWSRQIYAANSEICIFRKGKVLHWPPLWSSGQSFWLQILSSRVWFLALPDFLRVWNGAHSACEDNWGATRKEK